MKRDRRALAVSAIATSWIIAQPAIAETVLSVTVSPNVAAGTNPFLLGSEAPGGVAVSIEAQPVLKVTTARSTLTVRGDVQIDQYLKDYGSDVSASAGATYATQLSSRVSAQAQASFTSSRTLLRDYLRFTNDPALIDPPIVIGPDPSLDGTRTRKSVLDASVGLSFTPSGRDTWTVSGGFQKSWVDRPGAFDFSFVNGLIGYNRVISDRVTLNGALQVGSSNYIDRDRGDGVIISPQVGATVKLNSVLTVTAMGGMSFQKITTDPGVKQSSTQLTGTLQVCHESERQSVCLSGTRAVQPTYIGVVHSISRVMVDYSRRVSRRGDVAFHASFVTSGNRGLENTPVASLQYFNAGGTYTLRVNRRLQGFVSAGADKALRSTFDRPTNYYFRAGLRFVFGSLQ